MAKKKGIISVMIIIWMAFFFADFSLAKLNKAPVFAIPVLRYKDGGSTEYFGLGYKVIKYVNLTAERGPELVRVDFGSWFMKFVPQTKKYLADRRPMVMINDELYFDTNRESELNARCGVMDGKISSSVGGSELPKQNNQSNFGAGYEYQYVDENSIDIYINEKWIRFEKETD